ncbi:hypothetical protein HYC85_016551 [Camellia sinensis]|uniref:Leucine-rich repeat-containing N-terminal plant-type domain-containing protein n=1 Tax=Camellia sinensis TaxID=4442 RepID=A0A7J7GZX6_CAMSI|nr:hypothetical protein HYC85_016551 [Camellia sinensis]
MPLNSVCTDGGDLKRKLIFTGFERLSILGKLELLRLDWNSFNNNILSSLGVFSSLKTLSLSTNHLTGSIDIRDMDQRPMEEGGRELSTTVTTTVTQKGDAAGAMV